MHVALLLFTSARTDIDAVLKGTLDALARVLGVDDRYFMTLHVYKHVVPIIDKRLQIVVTDEPGELVRVMEEAL